MLKVFTVFTVRRVESVCIEVEEDTLIFEVNLVEVNLVEVNLVEDIVEDNGMLDDDDGVDKRARTPRPLPGSIRSTRSIGRGDRKCEEVEIMPNYIYSVSFLIMNSSLLNNRTIGT